MTAIRIHPVQVRASGVAAVACGDDLRTQATLLRAVALPAMPVAMAARHRAALDAVGARVARLAEDLASMGEELQVRAAAAEAADAPGEARGVAAGRSLAKSLVTTTTIVGAAGSITSATITTNRTRVVAATSTGLRLTIPDALERLATPATAAAQAPNPQETARERPSASRPIEANAAVGGAPAAAVHHAVAPAAGSPHGLGAATALSGDAIDPAEISPGEHRAEAVATSDSAPGAPTSAEMPAAGHTDQQDWACWMAASAAQQGLPPALPVMMALAQSGLRNVPTGESDVGFFALDPSRAYAPAGHGVGRGVQPDGDWWAAHPDAQLDHLVRRLGDVAGGMRTEGLDDPEALARWASDAVPHMDTSRFAEAGPAADELVSHCRQQHMVAPVPAGGHLGVAKSQLGNHEFGTNSGPQVDRYLEAADTPSGNPWCASFVAWSMQESGHEMPGTGWAAVSSWVDAAKAGEHGLHIVDASSARPGDIVAYDWGGGWDFSSDGHIGFLESTVENGSFTTVEGNAQDAVSRMDRSLGVGNVVFIRPGG